MTEPRGLACARQEAQRSRRGTIGISHKTYLCPFSHKLHLIRRQVVSLLVHPCGLQQSEDVSEVTGADTHV
eukprot:17074-Eustigmatos_ZCMA.PRE.1